ncbi:MAG: hypothetical protein ACI4K7_11900 [Oscillospiraceae bacterium]
MNNNTELNRLEEALRNDEELRKKLDEACKRIAESGEAKSDGEVMVKAAAELGFSITIEALERAKAAAEELNEDALDMVAGGGYVRSDKLGEDNRGHSNWCLTLWHCDVITLHTETTTHEESCFTNYICDTINNH